MGRRAVYLFSTIYIVYQMIYIDMMVESYHMNDIRLPCRNSDIHTKSATEISASEFTSASPRLHDRYMSLSIGIQLLVALLGLSVLSFQSVLPVFHFFSPPSNWYNGET